MIAPREVTTPHRTNNRGSFLLERRCGPLGRVRVASGTSDPLEHRELNDMITRLKRDRRWDLLALLVPPRAGLRAQVTPHELLEALMQGKTGQLPTADDLRTLAAAVPRWIERLDRAKATVHHHESNLTRFIAAYPEMRFADLPARLADAKQVALASGKRSTFHDLRISCLALLRDIVGVRHRLYEAVKDVEPLIVTRRKGNPLTPNQVRALVLSAPAAAGEIWGLALTGMRRGEFWGSWDVLPDRIDVHGTKTAAAERSIVRVYPVAHPVLTYDQFVRILRDVSDSTVIPHDLRKTNRTWLDDAGVPLTWRRYYAGHHVNLDDLYERSRDLTRALVEHAELMRGFLGEPPTQRLAVQK